MTTTRQLGGLPVDPMREDKRVGHVRKHLLNPREAFWQLAPELSQSRVRETARRFARSGLPCGHDADDHPVAATDPRAIECHGLHDAHYAPLYEAAIDLAAAGLVQALEYCRLRDGGVAFRITLEPEALIVVASGRCRLRVKTAYRARNAQDAVRKHRAHASLESDAEGDSP